MLTKNPHRNAFFTQTANRFKPNFAHLLHGWT